MGPRLINVTIFLQLHFLFLALGGAAGCELLAGQLARANRSKLSPSPSVRRALVRLLCSGSERPETRISLFMQARTLSTLLAFVRRRRRHVSFE